LRFRQRRKFLQYLTALSLVLLTWSLNGLPFSAIHEKLVIRTRLIANGSYAKLRRQLHCDLYAGMWEKSCVSVLQARGATPYFHSEVASWACMRRLYGGFTAVNDTRG